MFNNDLFGIKHFRLIPFIGGVLLAVSFLSIFKMEAHSIFQYPHPDNIHERVYKDKNGACYAYTAETVNCNDNESILKEYPLQN
jgi:hypothetical protein